MGVPKTKKTKRKEKGKTTKKERERSKEINKKNYWELLSGREGGHGEREGGDGRRGGDGIRSKNFTKKLAYVVQDVGNINIKIKQKNGVGWNRGKSQLFPKT